METILITLVIVIVWLTCFAYNAINRLTSHYYYGWVDLLIPLIVAVGINTGAILLIHYLASMNFITLLIVISNVGVIISSYLGLFLGRAMLRSLPKRDIWSMRFD